MPEKDMKITKNTSIVDVAGKHNYPSSVDMKERNDMPFEGKENSLASESMLNKPVKMKNLKGK